MAKSSETISTAKISSVLSPSVVSRVENFLSDPEITEPSPESGAQSNSYSDLVRGLLKLDQLQRGRITCLLSVKPFVSNVYGGLHGGAVAAAAEVVSLACARTVVGEDKELFLGELGITYLSSAPINAEVMIEGSIVRSGRNLTVTSIEFRLKETKKLIYVARATFYNMPMPKL
ncbi:Thioesterase domain [Dillenia turbinata]|uniref:Thioesterase domain n=1 Tax=Dillenia turbinata TaxID=194707 RepID=A0AAN8Z0P1_9MAGN